MICPNPRLLSDERSRLLTERQRLLRELLHTNHQLALEAQKLGLTIKEAIRLAKEHA